MCRWTSAQRFTLVFLGCETWMEGANTLISLVSLARPPIFTCSLKTWAQRTLLWTLHAHQRRPTWIQALESGSRPAGAVPTAAIPDLRKQCSVSRELLLLWCHLEDPEGLLFVACRQSLTGASSAQNLQSPSTATLIHQRPASPSCTRQPLADPGLSNAAPALLQQSGAAVTALTSLNAFAGQALHIQVSIGLPPPPEFKRVPRWNSQLSTSTRAAVSGEVDGPAVLFYAVRNLLDTTLITCA